MNVHQVKLRGNAVENDECFEEKLAEDGVVFRLDFQHDENRRQCAEDCVEREDELFEIGNAVDDFDEIGEFQVE